MDREVKIMVVIEVKDGSLLEHLIDKGYDPEDYIDTVDRLTEEEEARVEYESHSEQEKKEIYNQEAIKFMYIDIDAFEEEKSEMDGAWAGWQHEEDVDMTTELAIIRAYVYGQKEN